MARPYRLREHWKTCTLHGPLRQARALPALSVRILWLSTTSGRTPHVHFADVLTRAREHIDVLVYAAGSLHEAYPRLSDLLRERATDGCLEVRTHATALYTDPGHVIARSDGDVRRQFDVCFTPRAVEGRLAI